MTTCVVKSNPAVALAGEFLKNTNINISLFFSRPMDLEAKHNVVFPKSWTIDTETLFKQQVLSRVNDMSDMEIQARISIMNLLPGMNVTFDERTKAYMQSLEVPTDDGLTDEQYQQLQGDFFDSYLKEKSVDKSINTTVTDYMNNGGIRQTFGVGQKTEKPAVLKERMMQLSPETIYRNEVERKFNKECQLTNHELDELCEDVTNIIYNLFTGMLDDDFERELMYESYPAIFKDSVKEEIDKVLSHPSDKQFAELANAIGTDNILYIARDIMLANPNCSPMMMDKLQIFSDGNDFGEDYIRLLMLHANPWIKDRLGLVFNTSIRKSDDTKAEVKRYPLEGDELSPDAGDTATFTEYEEEHEDDQDSQADEDMARNDFIKKDSLTQSFTNNLTKPVKEALSSILRRDHQNAFGKGTYYSWSEIANPLVKLVAKCNNGDELVKLVKNSQLPYRLELASIIESHPWLKSAIFSNFKKAETRYFELETWEDEDDEGNIVRRHKYARTLKDLNVRDAEDRLRALAASGDRNSLYDINYNDKLVTRKSNFEKLQKNLKILDENKQSSLPFSREAVQSFYTDDKYNAIIESFDALGYRFRVNKDNLKRWFQSVVTDEKGNKFFSLKNYNKLIDVLKNIYKNSTGNYYQSDAAIESTEVKNIPQLKKDIQAIDNLVDNIAGRSADHRVSSGGNEYSGYVNSNFLSRTFDKLNADYADREAYINRMYRNTPFFNSLFALEETCSQKNGWQPVSWLTETMFSPQNTLGLMQLRTMSTFNGKKFQELTLPEHFTAAMMAFNEADPKGKKVADYIMPVMSDKSRTCVISNRRYAEPQVVANLSFVFLQEAARMRDLVVRAENRTDKDSMVKNYDILLDNGKVTPITGGMEFCFMPMFNNLLEGINDDSKCKENIITAWLHEKIYNDDKYTDLYDRTKVMEAVRDRIDKWLEMQTNVLRNQLIKDGTYSEIAKNIGVGGGNFDALFKNFIYNNYFANTQIYMILAGDVAYYKGDNDVVKRFAEVISDGVVQDATALMRDGEVYTHADDKEGEPKHANFIILKDVKRKFRGFEGLMKIHAQRRDNDIAIIDNKLKQNLISKEKHDDLVRRVNALYKNREKNYARIDTTDGEGFMSFKGYCNMMYALGRSKDLDAIYDKYTKLYDEFAELFSDDHTFASQEDAIQELSNLLAKVQKFNKKNRMHFEVVKDMCYSIIDGKPVYVKNSMYPLLDIQSMIEDALPHDGMAGDMSMARLASFLHKNDIDTALFESNIKVGSSNVLTFNHDAGASTGLESVALGSAERDRKLLKMPVIDFMLQQETPDHSEDSFQPLGAQTKNIIFGALAADVKILDAASGQEKYIRDMMQEFEETMARRINRAANEQLDKAGLSGNMSTMERNLKLSKYIMDKLASSGSLNRDNMFRFSINDYGEFNVPLSDPVSRGLVDGIFTGAVKRAALEVEMPGGQLVQVSDGFRFNRETSTVKEDKSLRIAYKRKDGSITYNPAEANSIAYFEAEMPYYYKDMYRTNGELDERLSRLVMYRIPTEGACSIFPIKVVKWSNRISGGIVKLPAELPGIGGMDFDIDKLFFVAPSVDFKKVESEDPATGRKRNNMRSAHYVDKKYAQENAGNDDKADCNRILEIMWSVLTSPDNMKAMFINSNFYDLTHNRDVIVALNAQKYASPEEKSTRYNELQAMDDDQLADEAAKKNRPGLCNYRFQSETALINSMAKQLIGVFANANSQHTYLQGRGLQLRCFNLDEAHPCSINGNIVKFTNEFDPIYGQDGFTRINENITQFLTAATDAVKNPTLYQLNVNMFTVNLATALLRTGFDIETIILILQQPVIKYLSRQYDKEATRPDADEYVNIDKLLNGVIEQCITLKHRFGKKHDEERNRKMAMSNLHVTRDMLVKYIGEEISDMRLNGDDANMKSDQWELFKILYGFLSAKSDIQGSNSTLKMDVASQRHGSTMFEYADHLIRIANREETEQTVVAGFPQLAKEKANTLYQRITTSFNQQVRLLNAYASVYDRRLLDFLQAVYDDFKTLQKRPKPNDADARYRTNGIYSDWMMYRFVNDANGSNNITFGQDGAKGFIPAEDAFVTYINETFPNKVAELRRKLYEEGGWEDNVLLKHLNVVTINGQPKIRVQRKMLSNMDAARIGDDFMALLDSKDARVSSMAYGLIMYSFLTTGFRVGRDTFWQYVPAQAIARFENYVSFWRKVEDGLVDMSEFPKFAEMFLLNNLDLVKDSKNVIEKMAKDRYSAVSHRGRMSGTDVTVGNNKVYAVRMYDNKAVATAPIGELYDVATVFKHKTYNDDHLVPLDQYLQIFQSATRYFDTEMKRLKLFVDYDNGIKYYNVNGLTDKQALDIVNSQDFEYLKKVNPYITKNASSAREFLNMFSRFC